MSANKRVHLVLPPAPEVNCNDEEEGEESEEDELYGRQVLDDDGLNDDAVAQKPQARRKSRTGDEHQPRGAHSQSFFAF